MTENNTESLEDVTICDPNCIREATPEPKNWKHIGIGYIAGVVSGFFARGFLDREKGSDETFGEEEWNN